MVSIPNLAFGCQPRYAAKDCPGFVHRVLLYARKAFVVQEADS